MRQLQFLCILLIFKQIDGEIEPFIQGGEYTSITKYQHSIRLSIICGTGQYICGGSILNQRIVLTAAHCLEECSGQSHESVTLKYGHEMFQYMKSVEMTRFKLHDNYKPLETQDDICLVLSKTPIKLDNYAKRVIILPHYTTAKYGYVAGWGVINEEQVHTKTLKHTRQNIQPPHVCKLMGNIPKGSYCAGPIKGVGNPLGGDSGSALVVNSYIQIGLVSYKVLGYTLVVYTNTTSYFNWIVKESRNLYCK